MTIYFAWYVLPSDKRWFGVNFTYMLIEGNRMLAEALFDRKESNDILVKCCQMMDVDFMQIPAAFMSPSTQSRPQRQTPCLSDLNVESFIILIQYLFYYLPCCYFNGL